MRVQCNVCNNEFNFKEVPKFCPFCGSSGVERNMKKQRATALSLIKEYNDLVEQMTSFMAEYNRIIKRDKEIRALLRSYKHRNVITDEELPYNRNETIISLTKRKMNGAEGNTNE